MKLRYRGITYSNQNAQVETVASDGVAKFLGQTYFPFKALNHNWD